jgi:arabinogalactan endo-1,4-beta-galactosidase
VNSILKQISVAGYSAALVIAGLLSPLANSLQAAPFAKGADVGWLSQMEASGIKFFSADGAQQDCLRVLQGCGMNSIRLRVWVSPTDGGAGKEFRLPDHD